MMSWVLMMAAQAASSGPPPASVPAQSVTVSPGNARAFFAVADTDRDGSLNPSEFQEAMDARLDAVIANNPAARPPPPPRTRAEIRRAFVGAYRELDTDSDGHLTPAEFTENAGRIVARAVADSAVARRGH